MHTNKLSGHQSAAQTSKSRSSAIIAHAVETGKTVRDLPQLLISSGAREEISHALIGWHDNGSGRAGNYFTSVDAALVAMC